MSKRNDSGIVGGILSALIVGIVIYLGGKLYTEIDLCGWQAVFVKCVITR